MEELELWCCLEGDCSYFQVSILPSKNIYALKEKIYNTQRYQNTVRVQDLILHKVRYIMMSMREH